MAQLNFSPSGEETEKFAALDQYLVTLNSYERLSAEATQHGIHMAGVTTRSGEVRDIQSRQPGASGMHEVQTCIPEDDQNKTSMFLNSLAVKEDPKRSSHISSSSSSTSSESDSGQGPSSKRKCIYEKDLPWYSQEIMA